jgi:hypothetical protein
LLTPITGIVVRADELTAGHGCGTGPDQIYKYVGVVQIPADAGPRLNLDFVAAGVSDCYADLSFTNLCTYGPTASNAYLVSVYAYTAAAWNGLVNAGDAGVDAAPSPSGDASLDAETDAPSDGGAPSDAGAPVASAESPAELIPSDIDASDTQNYCTTPNSPSLFPGVLLGDLASTATWSTTCTATQQSDIAVLAQCALPLTKR